MRWRQVARIQTVILNVWRRPAASGINFGIAKKSGVKGLPGGRNGEIQLLLLDAGGSVALAHMDGSGTLKTVIKGVKHNGIPYYYPNTYLLFRCDKPHP